MLATVSNVLYLSFERKIAAALAETREAKSMLVVSTDSNITAMEACGLIGKHFNQSALNLENEMRKSKLVNFNEQGVSAAWNYFVHKHKLSKKSRLIEEKCQEESGSGGGSEEEDGSGSGSDKEEGNEKDKDGSGSVEEDGSESGSDKEEGNEKDKDGSGSEVEDGSGSGSDKEEGNEKDKDGSGSEEEEEGKDKEKDGSGSEGKGPARKRRLSKRVRSGDSDSDSGSSEGSGWGSEQEEEEVKKGSVKASAAHGGRIGGRRKGEVEKNKKNEGKGEENEEEEEEEENEEDEEEVEEGEEKEGEDEDEEEGGRKGGCNAKKGGGVKKAKGGGNAKKGGGVKKVKASAAQFKKKPEILTAQLSTLLRRTSKFGTLDDEMAFYNDCCAGIMPGFTPAAGQVQLTQEQFIDLPPQSVSYSYVIYFHVGLRLNICSFIYRYYFMDWWT